MGPNLSFAGPHKTTMVPFPPELSGYRFLVVGSSLLLAGAGSVALFVAFSGDSTGGSPIPFVLFALIAFAVSGFGLFFVPRWYRRAANVVATTTPWPGLATLTLETDSDSTSLYATVSTLETSARPLGHIAVLMPRWDVRPLLGASLSVDLHIEPSSSHLVAISTDRGLLWCMPTGWIARQWRVS